MGIIPAFIEYVTKLNDIAFRPFLRRFVDWGFTSSQARKTLVFCHVYTGLLSHFKVRFVLSLPPLHSDTDLRYLRSPS